MYENEDPRKNEYSHGHFKIIYYLNFTEWDNTNMYTISSDIAEYFMSCRYSLRIYHLTLIANLTGTKIFHR